MLEFVSLLSGLDSYVGARIQKGFLRRAVYFNYGQPEYEQDTAELLSARLGVTIDVLSITIFRESYESSYYPFRNALLLTHAANFLLTTTDINTIVTGLGTATDCGDKMDYPDTSLNFINSLLYTLNYGLEPADSIQIINPVNGWTKKEIFKWLIDNGDQDLIPATTSCYEDSYKKHEWGIGCGECLHCKARKYDYESLF